MFNHNIKSPGVYINETDAFPKSVVPVATAVPAFIGYTPQASYEGKSYFSKAQKIKSLAQFQEIYCHPNPSGKADTVKQYNPQFYAVKQNSKPDSGDHILVEGQYYSLLPDADTIYYLYNSIRLFYLNGGRDAYIVSVGSYGPSSKNPLDLNDQMINSNVKLGDLKDGLALLKNESEPTMYVCPETTLLSSDDQAILIQAMLSQCDAMQTAMSIIDVAGGRKPDPVLYENDIETFRNSTGTQGLCYGAAYYPFLGTTVMEASEIDYTNLFDGEVNQLKSILNPKTNSNSAASAILANIENPPKEPLTTAQNHSALAAASPIYTNLMKVVLNASNILPPCGGLAGIIASTDSTRGVWQAPANRSLSGVSSLTIQLSNAQQEPLNIDAISGKSINVIRSFPGYGTLVWGARTLDGNSQDWRYISVRRTITFIKQSSRLTAQAYVFEPNTSSTWTAVKSIIENFLSDLWKQGGLAGSTPGDAFSVDCGLGSTMTPEDILNGLMRVTIKVAVARPAEFIVLAFQQEMTKPS